MGNVIINVNSFGQMDHTTLDICSIIWPIFMED